MGMSVMDAVASLDWKHKYLMLMTSRGYLRVLVDQLLEEDAELQGVLSLQPQSMKPLYLFESKMVCIKCESRCTVKQCEGEHILPYKKVIVPYIVPW